MELLIDENIFDGYKVYSLLGNTVSVPGRSIHSKDLDNKDILIVRSVTPVNENLLKNSSIKFVGTTSAGYDHIDTVYLKKNNIGFASAPDCNSNSVAEYVIAALLYLNKIDKISISDIKLGIIGAGNVGSRVIKKAEALGIKVVIYDPPLAKKSNKFHFTEIDTVLNCDVISIHVPLTDKKDNPTKNMFNEKMISKINKKAIIINTSRGNIIDEQALKKALKNKHLSGAVIDVWANEPEIDIELLKLVDTGTPHIAGHSINGKLNGTIMIYQAICKFSGIPELFKKRSDNKRALHINTDFTESNLIQNISSIMDQFYSIKKDDTDLRKIIDLPDRERGLYFDSLRKFYPARYELSGSEIKSNCQNQKLIKNINKLGLHFKKNSIKLL